MNDEAKTVRKDLLLIERGRGEEGTMASESEKCRIGEGCGDELLNSDVLRDVLRRVDGATLGRLSAVSKQLRSAAEEESLWECLSNERWPSTTHAAAKTLIASAGGYRKIYTNCFPFVTPRQSQQEADEHSTAADDFLVLLDVVCGGELVLSHVLDGINGADALCGQLVDIICEGCNKLLPRGAQSPRDHMRLSWILVHKKTLRMVNLSSWTPISTLRHRGYDDDDVLLCFSTILPNPSTSSLAVLCNILMRCNLEKVTELGFTLEAGDGGHILRRHEAVAALSCTVASRHKTSDHARVAKLYHEFVAAQRCSGDRIIRREGRRHCAIAIACFVGVVVVCALFCSHATKRARSKSSSSPSHCERLWLQLIYS